MNSLALLHLLMLAGLCRRLEKFNSADLPFEAKEEVLNQLFFPFWHWRNHSFHAVLNHTVPTIKTILLLIHYPSLLSSSLFIRNGASETFS